MTLFDSYINAVIALLNGRPLPLIDPIGRSVKLALGAGHPGLVVHAGTETVVHENTVYATRRRELLCSYVTQGEVPDEEEGQLAETYHPIVMSYRGLNMSAIDEVGVDEPRYTPERVSAIVVRRYVIEYRTSRGGLNA